MRFFLGLVVGAVLVVLALAIAVFAVVGQRNKPPAIAAGSTLVLHLEGDLPERAPAEVPFDAFGQKPALTLEDNWAMLRRAAADSRIKAVVIEPHDLSVGWGKMEELHADLEKFRKSGKPLYAYLKTPGTRDYYVATAASKVFLSQEDMLNLKGLRFEMMYFRRTLDKLGVSVDVEHAGKYKDYMDMFTRSDMSPETREVLTSVIDRLYGDLVRTIALGRKKPVVEVQDAIDNGPLLSGQVFSRGLVDGLCYENEMFGKLRDEMKADVRQVTEREYVKATDADAGIAGKQQIAFVVAQGEIVRGDPESSSTGGSAIESESFTKLLQKVGTSSAKAVIVRIDSPGGEVFASDELWKAMNELRKKKPTVVSMSDTAASGGYYMAMNKTPIVAYPGTLTGSIGVIFGKPILHGLYDKLGIDKDGLQRGRFAGIESDYQPLSEAERAKLREGIDLNYQGFVQKVADSRKRAFGQIEPLAQGRVWLGDQAKENGLVDELGGIDRAIELVKSRAQIRADEQVTLVTYPPRRSWLELLTGTAGADGGVESQIGRTLSALMGRPPVGLAPGLWESAGMRVWQHGGYLSISPWTLSIQ